MELATTILIYAWTGLIFYIFLTALVLIIVSCVVAYIGNVIYKNLMAIYKLECIDFYFEKMENEGAHAFKKKEDKYPNN